VFSCPKSVGRIALVADFIENQRRSHLFALRFDVYSTCIFCHGSLGTNEAIEHFPVGRRLAFDAAKGRLWVVCKGCARWNLSPIEERWEAIEECEKLFRDTRLRVSTGNIGLARLEEGTTLVRIGDPQRPEMAAWRYGDQFRSRRLKHLVLFAGTVAALGALETFGHEVAIYGSITVAPLTGTLFGQLMGRTRVRVPIDEKLAAFNSFELAQVSLRPGEEQGYVLEVPVLRDHFPQAKRRWYEVRVPARMATRRLKVLYGGDAIRAARHLLPLINSSAGSTRDLGGAISVLESSRGTDYLLSSMASRGTFKPSILQQYAMMFGPAGGEGGGPIGALPAHVRLAIEMSLHEEDERRALEGELSELEDRWREAEEIAAIADGMFVPSGVSAAFTRLKGTSP
jgi:hypothetical protein